MNKRMLNLIQNEMLLVLNCIYDYYLSIMLFMIHYPPIMFCY